MQIKVEAGTIDFANVQLPQFGNSLFIHLAQLCNLKVLFIYFFFGASSYHSVLCQRCAHLDGGSTKHALATL